MSRKFIDRQLLENVRTVLEKYKETRESDIDLYGYLIRRDYYLVSPFGLQNVLTAWKEKKIPNYDTIQRYARLLKKRNKHLAGKLQLEKEKKRRQVQKEVRDHSRPPEPTIMLDIDKLVA